MKTKYHFLPIATIILLGSLVFWQLRHLDATQELKTELEVKEIQATLMNVAINLRELERVDSTLRENKTKRYAVIDSLININFKIFNYDFEWGIADDNGILEEDLLNTNDPEKVINSKVKVCLSCLVTIKIVEEQYNEDSGFILNQTPAQMMQMSGMDASKIKYIHLWYDRAQSGSFAAYIVPLTFLVSLVLLFFWLLFLMRKQALLIRQKSEFVNHLSHQFQTPLSSIKIGANLLAKKYKDEELIQIVQTEGNRLENHIKTVLHWVKSDADRLQVLKEDVRITDSIENALKEMRPVFQTNKTIVQFFPPEEEYVIKADRNHLQLMLFNLWENAIKHNDQCVNIKVEVKKHSKMLAIEVLDDGKGVENLNEAIKQKGLGLQYIDTIMKEHKGSVVMSSNKPKGFLVILNFPINE